MKQRILFIDGPLNGGGAERVLIDVLRNIDYSRFDVDLAVICRGGALMDEVPEQVRVIELWPGYSWDYKLAYRLSKWLHCNRLFSRKMNGSKLRRDYDLEISFLEGMPLKLGAMRTTPAKKATWVHVDLFKYPYESDQFFKGEELRAYNKMDVVVNVSKDCNDAFSKRFADCTAERRVIYNPIDRAKIERMAARELSVDKGYEPTNPTTQQPNNATSQQPINIITVGRLTEQKNPARLLEVARLAKDAGLPVHFKWVGDGGLRAEMERLSDEMGLHDMVEFTGFVKNPYPHIKAADIMLVTSDFEGFCLVICEAQCLGVPVISTPTAGPCEIIGKNEYGLLADFTAQSLFEKLKRMVENPEERRVLATRASARPNDFSVTRTIQALENLL